MKNQTSKLTISNARTRLFLLILAGLIAFAAIFYWRQQTLKQAEYINLQTKQTEQVQAELKSKNFQIQVQDSSPTAK